MLIRFEGDMWRSLLIRVWSLRNYVHLEFELSNKHKEYPTYF